MVASEATEANYGIKLSTKRMVTAAASWSAWPVGSTSLTRPDSLTITFVA